jgi:hypothetical protein
MAGRFFRNSAFPQERISPIDLDRELDGCGQLFR